jgi:hypothetical protein
MSQIVARPLFEFESADSLAQFFVFMTPLVGGGVVAVLSLDLGGWRGLVLVVLACFAVLAGLRSKVVVYSHSVNIQRKWFFLPYRTYIAPCIDDVFYGGDWGLEEGAIGVVVRMGGQEVHLGTAKNMRFLHDALTSAAHSRRAQ